MMAEQRAAPIASFPPLRGRPAPDFRDGPATRDPPMFTVVVLDDNAAIRELISEWLAAAGHDVMDARTIAACCAAGEPGAGSVGLVLLDLPMLRDGVRTLIERVRATYPDAALLGLSTQVSEALTAASPAARQLGLQGLLPKPCLREELLAAVRPLLRKD